MAGLSSGDPSLEEVGCDTTTFVLVHSPRATLAAATTRFASRARSPATASKRASQRGSRDGSCGDPRNFLLSGGSRALDGERAKEQAAAARAQARSMKGANSALAAELARVRQAGQREGGALRGELAALAGRFQAEQGCLEGLRERLAEEVRGRMELEAAHQERVLDLCKRLQAEHLLRVNAELDAGRASDKASAAAVQLKGLEQALEAARREAAEGREGRLEAEATRNKERLAQAGLLADVEALKTEVAREKHSREAQQRKCSEVEASLRSTTTRCTEAEDRLRSAQAEARAAGQGRAAAEASALRSRQDLQAAQEQLEAARKGRAEAGAEAAALQRQVAELEASAALYIAKEAHYDDLKAEQDQTCQRLEKCREELGAARSEARTAAEQLGELSRQAAKVPGLTAQLEQAEDDLKEAQGLLGDTQAAFKLLMETAREREAALEGLEGQLEAAKGLAESLRRARDEAVADSQGKDAVAGSLRDELLAAQEEAGGWQRRCKQLQGEADGRELELARRDLQSKELADALHLLNSKADDSEAAAASDKRRLEGVVRSLEGRLSQVQSEVARMREELSSAEQGQVTARAELAAVQEDNSRLRAQLNEEQLRASKLRSELASLSSSRMKEQQEKGGLLSDTLSRLQAEEAAKAAAQQEAKAMRRRVEQLEGSLGEMSSAKTRSEEAYEGSQAALESMRRKLETYKRENKNLLASYDSWLKGVVAQRQPVVGASP
ncbi:hypothetical protein ABPG77_005791 [Micractinium sp. CCAP 211/92]